MADRDEQGGFGANELAAVLRWPIDGSKGSVCGARRDRKHAVRQIEWQGHAVEVHADQWVGRFDAAGGQGSMPVVSLLPTTAWKAESLGGNFFSLTTPGASVQEVLALAGRTPGIRSFEPDFVL